MIGKYDRHWLEEVLVKAVVLAKPPSDGHRYLWMPGTELSRMADIWVTNNEEALAFSLSGNPTDGDEMWYLCCDLGQQKCQRATQEQWKPRFHGIQLPRKTGWRPALLFPLDFRRPSQKIPITMLVQSISLQCDRGHLLPCCCAIPIATSERFVLCCRAQSFRRPIIPPPFHWLVFDCVHVYSA